MSGSMVNCLKHIKFLFKYDISVTTISPEGKIYQVEYAQKAVENSE